MSGTLSSREKTLSILVGVIAFFIVTFFVSDYFLKSKAALSASLDAKARQLKMMQTLGAEKAMWEQRDAWLREKQPKLANEDSAGVQLLDLLKELAKRHTVLLESPVIRPTDRKPDFTAVVVEIETKSSWRDLVAFLGDLQKPDQFIALNSATLKIDAADATQMRGKFKIARWFAPK